MHYQRREGGMRATPRNNNNTRWEREMKYRTFYKREHGHYGVKRRYVSPVKNLWLNILKWIGVI